MMQKPKLFVATPMFGNMCYGSYATSLIDLMSNCARLDIPCMMQTRFNDSLVPRARNFLVHEFLKTDFTHFLFIDADIEFQVQDIFEMIKKDVDVIGGIYPRKDIDWEAVSRAVKAGVDPKDLHFYSSPLNFNPLTEEPLEALITDAVEVKDIPTGFMLVKREVFEKLKPEVETCVFRWNEPPHNGETCYCFFDTKVEGDEYLSEDWYFCRKWLGIGGKIHAAPWVRLIHHGTYAYRGAFMPKLGG
jgi:hypothetical protein